MALQKAEKEEQKPEKEKKEQKEFVQVVAKLPVQEIRRIEKEDGTIINLLTIEEAITALINGAK